MTRGMAATLTRSSDAVELPALTGFLVAAQVAGMLGLTMAYGELHGLRSPGIPGSGEVGLGLVEQLASVLAWIAIYALVALAGWATWRTPRSPARTLALRGFAVQLALPPLWAALFFGSGRTGAGVLVLAAALAAMIATGLAIGRVSRRAALLFGPIVIATGHALALAISVWRSGVLAG